MPKITLVISKALLAKTDETALALCISRADYIRQALAKATRKDEARVDKELSGYAPTTTQKAKQESDEALLRKYGIL